MRYRTAPQGIGVSISTGRDLETAGVSTMRVTASNREGGSHKPLRPGDFVRFTWRGFACHLGYVRADLGETIEIRAPGLGDLRIKPENVAFRRKATAKTRQIVSACTTSGGTFPKKCPDAVGTELGRLPRKP